jgi:hypothetical protein
MERKNQVCNCACLKVNIKCGKRNKSYRTSASGLLRNEIFPHLFLNMTLKYTFWYLLQYGRAMNVFYDYNYFNLIHDYGMSVHFDSELLKKFTAR